PRRRRWPGARRRFPAPPRSVPPAAARVPAPAPRAPGRCRAARRSAWRVRRAPPGGRACPAARAAGCRWHRWPRARRRAQAGAVRVVAWRLLAPSWRAPAARYLTQVRRRPAGVVPGSAAVAAPRGAGLVDHDLRQLRQRRLQALPDPDREALAGRVLQPFDLVEVVVVQLPVQRLEGGLDVGVVHHPLRAGLELALDPDFDAERM